MGVQALLDAALVRLERAERRLDEVKRERDALAAAFAEERRRASALAAELAKRPGAA